MFSFKKIFSNTNSDNNNIPNILIEDDIIHMYKQLIKMKKTRPNLDVNKLLMKCFEVDLDTLEKIISSYLRNH
jgi:predicted HTH transcriptional regulator